MRKYFFICNLFFILVSRTLYGQWIQQPGPVTNGIKFIKFINENTAFVQPGISSPDLLKTTNSGVNWFNLSSQYVGKTFLINDSTLVRLTSPNRLVKSADGGVSWEIIYTMSATYPINDVCFVNDKTGWICTQVSDQQMTKVWRTTNGGQSFEEQFSENSVHNFAKVHFKYDTVSGKYKGFAMLNAPYGVISTNSGETWSEFVSFPGGASSTKVKFSNINTGYINSGAVPRLFKTTNGGWNWTFMDLPRNLYDGYYEIKDFCVINPDSLIYCVGGTQNIWGGFLWKTTNGGINWRIQVFDSASHAGEGWGIDFINANTGWAFLNGGTYKTTNGGGNSFILTGIEQIGNLIPNNFLLHQNYPNPFNPSTRINYELRNSNYVTLKVFDLLGKEVATLVNEKQNAGSYAVDFNSTEFNLPSGIYFYTLSAGDYKETRKMVLVK